MNRAECTLIMGIIKQLMNDCEAYAFINREGERYNYAFHWANKIGSWTEDNIFDEMLKGDER